MSTIAPAPTRRCARCGIVDDLGEFISRGRPLNVCATCRNRPGRPEAPKRPRRPQTRAWSREELVRALLDWRSRNGSFPTATTWQHDRPSGAPAYESYRKRFGGWAQAIYAARCELEARSAAS